NRLSDEDIALGLINKERIEESKARAIAKSAHGDYNKALQSLYQKEDEWPFDQWFVDWVRSAFRAHKEARVVTQLVSWSDTLAGIGRENQKLFLEHCLEIFRQAFLLNYQMYDLVYYQSK